jgi:hypothetical protein
MNRDRRHFFNKLASSRQLVNTGNPLPIDVGSSGKALLSLGMIIRKELFRQGDQIRRRRGGGTYG